MDKILFEILGDLVSVHPWDLVKLLFLALIILGIFWRIINHQCDPERCCGDY